ncbi:MAG: AmmeMemoRadiSam system radical SAM enzyme [Candidatus Micrarchaeota archaeon]|nr:AmmeMemoRadiSam system radical SAM enzyme [Candidatus Micrarchaeota archaeon]
MKEALFYEKTGEDSVRCNLCARRCVIAEGKKGFCLVRKNIEGVLYSLVYGKCNSIAIDPIEKKPLFHFEPGTECLSIATVGCNFRCSYCQNWQISQEYGEIGGEDISPAQIVDIAIKNGLSGIAYTYTEPTIFYEYAIETMRIAKENGLYNVWVSNGYTTPEVIGSMKGLLDAVNVDWKGPPSFYRELCAVSDFEPVKAALKAYKENGIWIEITNLIIEGRNDREEDMREMASWIKKNLGEETPLHLTAFYPQYKLNSPPPTSPETLERARGIAMEEGLPYVYLGNVQSPFSSTFCPKCGEIVVDRSSYSANNVHRKCPKCGFEIALKYRQK